MSSNATETRKRGAALRPGMNVLVGGPEDEDPGCDCWNCFWAYIYPAVVVRNSKGEGYQKRPFCISPYR